MNLSTGSGKLAFAIKGLRAHWDQTANEWIDAVRSDFEEQYLKPIDDEVNGTLNAITNLSHVLTKAVQECEERGERI